MEELTRRVQDALAGLQSGISQGLVEDLISEFSDAYTKIVQPTFELTALDDYPSLTFAPPPSDFEPQRLRVENRRLMNTLAVPKPEAPKRTAPAVWLRNTKDSAPSTADFGALDQAPDFSGPIAFPQARA